MASRWHWRKSWNGICFYAAPMTHGMIGFAPIERTVYCVVFVEREDDVMRVISLRKATRKEVKDYAAQI